MKVIKWFAIGLLILILIAFASVFVLITFYKKELTGLLKDELRTRYNTVLEVQDVSVSFIDNWPHASVDLKKVELRSALAPDKMDPVLRAGSLALAFDLLKLTRGEFVARYLALHDAEILMLKNPDGDKNFIFKKAEAVTQNNKTQSPASPKPEQSITFELREINLKKVHYVFHNEQREQKIDLTVNKASIKLRNFTDGVKGEFKGSTSVKALMLNRRRGTFFENTSADLHLDLVFMKESMRLCFFPGSFAEIQKQKYQLAGVVEPGEQKRFAISVSTADVELKKLTSLLSAPIRATLGNFDVKKPVNVKLTLSGAIAKREEPAFVIHFSSNRQELSIGKSKIPYSDLDFTGRIVSLDSTHTKGDLKNAYVLVSPVRGMIYKHPFTAKVLVSNLTDPQITIDAMLHVLAENIDFKVAKDFVLQGKVTAQVNYSGPAGKLNSLEFLDKPMKLKAKLRFYDLSYREFNRPYGYKVNGLAQLNNRDLFFDSLRLNTVAGQAKLKGRAENFMPYVLGYTSGFKANLAARSELIDLNPVLMKDKKPAATANASKQTEQKNVQAKMHDAASAVSGRFEFNVQLFAKKMLMRQMTADYVTADLNYKTDLLTIKALHLSTCEGKMSASGTIQDFNKVRGDLKVDNVNVNTLFRQCENFGQDAVKSDNLKGNLSCDARFRSELDDKMEVIGETMSADVRLNLRDGHLINFPPLQNMSNLVFRNRDFTDIAFSELHEEFELEGYRMNIHELEVSSSVLDMYVVNGLYDFKGVSNINVLVPWSNLKKRGKNFIPKNSGESSQNVKGLKLNFQGPKGNMKVSFGHKQLSEE